MGRRACTRLAWCGRAGALLGAAVVGMSAAGCASDAPKAAPSAPLNHLVWYEQSLEVTGFGPAERLDQALVRHDGARAGLRVAAAFASRTGAVKVHEDIPMVFYPIGRGTMPGDSNTFREQIVLNVSFEFAPAEKDPEQLELKTIVRPGITSDSENLDFVSALLAKGDLFSMQDEAWQVARDLGMGVQEALQDAGYLRPAAETGLAHPEDRP